MNEKLIFYPVIKLYCPGCGGLMDQIHGGKNMFLTCPSEACAHKHRKFKLPGGIELEEYKEGSQGKAG